MPKTIALNPSVAIYTPSHVSPTDEGFDHDKYVQMNEKFGLNEQRVYDRAGVRLTMQDDKIELWRKSPAPAFPSR